MSVVFLRVLRDTSKGIEVPELEAFQQTLKYIAASDESKIEMIACMCADEKLSTTVFGSIIPDIFVHHDDFAEVIDRVELRQERMNHVQKVAIVLVAGNKQDIVLFERLLMVARHINVTPVMVVGVPSSSWANAALSPCIRAQEPLVFLTLPSFPYQRAFLQDVAQRLPKEHDLRQRIQGVGPAMRVMKIQLRQEKNASTINGVDVDDADWTCPETV